MIVTLSPFCVFSGAQWSEGEVESKCSGSGTGGYEWDFSHSSQGSVLESSKLDTP